MKTIFEQLEPANIPLEKQVDLLAQFLIENFEENIGINGKSAGEGAVEMAVRLLVELKVSRVAKKAARVSPDSGGTQGLEHPIS